MRAAVMTEPGGPDVFRIEDRPDPRPGPDEVLLAVHASALNRADLGQRRGGYPAPPGIPQDIPGLEAAGEVIDVGERVTAWSVGDRVMALLGGGGYASRVAVHERMAMRIPEGLTYEQAASIPEVFLTAFDAIVLQCGLVSGESVLIHAVGSGVGTAALQIAATQSCMTFGTAGSADKLEQARSLGLDVGINYREEDFAAVVRERTGGRGVEVVLDVVGGPYWRQNLDALAVQGRMIIVGSMGGSKVDDLGPLSRKRLSVRGTGLRGRPLEEKATLTQEFVRRVLPLIARGRIVPVIDRVFPLDQVGEAHRRMESNENFGKIVLAIDPS